MVIIVIILLIVISIIGYLIYTIIDSKKDKDNTKDNKELNEAVKSMNAWKITLPNEIKTSSRSSSRRVRTRTFGPTRRTTFNLGVKIKL